jgi:hypothetical protein
VSMESGLVSRPLFLGHYGDEHLPMCSACPSLCLKHSEEGTMVSCGFATPACGGRKQPPAWPVLRMHPFPW